MAEEEGVAMVGSSHLVVARALDFRATARVFERSQHAKAVTKEKEKGKEKEKE